MWYPILLIILGLLLIFANKLVVTKMSQFYASLGKDINSPILKARADKKYLKPLFYISGITFIALGIIILLI